MTAQHYTTKQLAQVLGGELSGDGSVVIIGVADLSDAGPDQASWVSSSQYTKRLADSRAGAVLIPHDLKATRPNVIRCENIHRSVAALLGLFAPPQAKPAPGIHPTAVISNQATIGEDASVGPYVFIDDGVTLGDRCVLHPGVFIGRGTTLGDDCVVYPNAVIREDCVIGHRVIIYPCAVIGADGFGFHFDNGRHNRVPHIGGVILGDDVEIGACSCVDRAKFGYTTVGKGTKIDNLVQVAHNVQIGEHCILAGHAGVAGSTRIGDHSAFGGKAAALDNLTIGRRVQVAGGDTTVTRDVPDGMTVSGFPAQEHRKELRERALIRRLPRLMEQLHALIERVERLESTTHNRT